MEWGGIRLTSKRRQEWQIRGIEWDKRREIDFGMKSERADDGREG